MLNAEPQPRPDARPGGRPRGGGPGAPIGGPGGGGPGGPGGGLPGAEVRPGPAVVVPPPAPPLEVRPAPPPAPPRIEQPRPVQAPAEQPNTLQGDRKYLYRETENLAPNDTRGPLYDAMRRLNAQWLDKGEVRWMSIARVSAIPIIGGIIGGILKPFQARGWMEMPVPVGAKPILKPFTGVLEHGAKFVPPSTTEYLIGAVGNIGIAGAVAGVLSPIVSGLRRLTGENAFSQFARFANRREDRGLLSRLVHGAESRALKFLFLREDRDTQQLLRIFDQRTDVNAINIGSRDRLNDLMAAGVMAEMKAQMIAEHNIQLSEKETVRVNRFHDAFRMAQRIYEAKIPTAGQRQIFVNDILPDLMMRRERGLYAGQTAALAGIGVAKAAGLALLGHVFALDNIQRLALGVTDVAKGVWKWGAGAFANTVQPAAIHIASIPHNIQTWAEYVSGTGAYGGWGARGGKWLRDAAGNIVPGPDAGGTFLGPKPGEWIGVPSRP